MCDLLISIQYHKRRFGRYIAPLEQDPRWQPATDVLHKFIKECCFKLTEKM